jgi:hypothetical protein
VVDAAASDGNDADVPTWMGRDRTEVAVNELFPVLSGLVVGVGLGLLAPKLRLWVGAVAAVVLGIAATVVSGEYRIGWEYLLIDIPLVAVASVVGLVASRAVRQAVAGGRDT